MPGWRAGWLVGPRQLVMNAEAMAQCMLFGLPGFVQEAAVTALGVSDAAECRVREYCAMRRDFLLAGLAGIPGLKCFVPDAGMFLLVDVRGTGLSGYDFMCELYRTERVSVLDGGAFGRETSALRTCMLCHRRATAARSHRSNTALREFIGEVSYGRTNRGHGRHRAKSRGSRVARVDGVGDGGPRVRRGAHRAARDRRELHRLLLPHRSLSVAVNAAHSRGRGRGCRRGNRRGSCRSQGG